MIRFSGSHTVIVPLVVILLLFIGSIPSAGAVRQFDTRYFTIIYDETGEYTAGEIAKFCDEIYENLMAEYASFTDDPRVVCIVNDAVDMANGYAIYYQNTITIYATNADFELRGQTNWLKNVFVHEMAHMIALKKAAKGPVNFISLGGAKYNENPDMDIDVAWFHLSQPAWFSEGCAQFGAESFGSDSWDTHRDMLLRSAWLEGKILTIDDMAVLPGKTSLDAELVYNQGYDLVRYISETFGREKVSKLNNTLTVYDFNSTIKDVLGISADKLYDRWCESLQKRYGWFEDREDITGELSQDLGSADYYPAVSPDGKWLAWLSNRGKDYNIFDLMVTDRATGKTRRLVKRVDYRVSWSPDSQSIVYVRRPDRNPRFYDIYIYDLAADTERRISKGLRARDPGFSPDGGSIVFVRSEGGNTSLALMESDGSNIRYLSSTHDGTQFYTPSFSPDGTRILFSLYRQNFDRDIAVIDAGSPTYRYQWEVSDSTTAFSDSMSFASGSNFKVLAGSTADERDPCWLHDSSGIAYVTDRSGVFNVYCLNPATGRTKKLTDVQGGAFIPSAGSDGSVYYALFKGNDFSIYRTESTAVIETVTQKVLARDYLKQPDAFDLSKHFDVSPYRRRRVVNAVVPTLNAGPSFIGSQFGLNVIDAGVRVYLSDLVGYDSFVAAGSVGWNLKEDVNLNNHVEFAYERAIIPVTSSSYEHAPRMFMQGSRSVINNYIHRQTASMDTVFYASRTDIGYENVLHDIHQTLEVNDEYRDEFRRFRFGVTYPLARRHTLSVSAGLRQYIESLERHEDLQDNSTLISENQEDITHLVSGTRTTSRYSTRYFTDMEYFKSHDIGINYSYIRSYPAADNMIAPKGTAFVFQYRHFRTAYADSLTDQPQYYAPLGVYSDGSIAVGEYNPDPMLDELRPFTKTLDVNEYIAIMRSNIQLPWWRHTLNNFVFAGYRDLYLKDARAGEGSGYNWPMKFYLGGQYMMSGYPYFAFWGSKIAYYRLGYTFPLFPKIGKDLYGVNLQRLYCNVFAEAGRVWNFERLSMDRLREGDVKRDVGVELRTSFITFYRFPTLFYARVAWPLDDMSGSAYDNDARRYYFGLRM